ncbi:hypothetical protein NMY22_g15745 [Coprinellus aureogranulatus]|nr:hypothetical protein NMY22_g15745 [Coprinellus aureogranulatus]
MPPVLTLLPILSPTSTSLLTVLGPESRPLSILRSDYSPPKLTTSNSTQNALPILYLILYRAVYAAIRDWQPRRLTQPITRPRARPNLGREHHWQ